MKVNFDAELLDLSGKAIVEGPELEAARGPVVIPPIDMT